MAISGSQGVGPCGACRCGRHAVATLAGLGAYDSVAGATLAFNQIAPVEGSSTVVTGAVGNYLTFRLQYMGSYQPASYVFTGSPSLPSGLSPSFSTADQTATLYGLVTKGQPSQASRSRFRVVRPSFLIALSRVIRRTRLQHINGMKGLRGMNPTRSVGPPRRHSPVRIFTPQPVTG